MIRGLTVATLSVFLALALYHPSLARPATTDKAPARLNLELGAYNVVRAFSKDSNSASSFALEYQDVPRLPYDIQLVAGILSNTDQDWFWYAGAVKDFDVATSTVLSLGFAPGYYVYGNKSVNLHNGLEFKSQIGLSYELQDKKRIGVSFAHISNASIGEDNPGVEVLSLTYSHPLSW